VIQCDRDILISTKQCCNRTIQRRSWEIEQFVRFIYYFNLKSKIADSSMSRSRFATHVCLYRNKFNDYKSLAIIDIFINQIKCAVIVVRTRSQLKIFN